MNTNRVVIGLAAAGCLTGLVLPQHASAAISDADFNALRDMVQQLSEQVKSLQQTNLVQAQAHQQDVEQIHELQSKLSQPQPMGTNIQNLIEAAQTQPIPREPIDEATVNHNFIISGDAEVQYNKVSHQPGSFLLADFAPIFLYRAGDNILFEAGFDTTIQNGDSAPNNTGYTTSFNLSFAQLDYVANDYVTICAGLILPPLGTYTERGAGWLNKIPDDPLAVDALLPGSGVGGMLRGAVPLGEDGKFINYSVWGVNGPSSTDTTGNAGALDLGGNVGIRSDGATANLHSDPSGGARVAFFMPLAFRPRYDLEVGVSGQSGEWDNGGTHLWSAGVLDASIHLGPNFEAKGEYILTRFGSDDMGLVDQQGWFVQASYKLAGLHLEVPVINDVELVSRYDFVRDGLGIKTRRATFGFIYYITNTFLFEGDYELVRSTDPTQANQLLLQLSLGF